jgi:hypothetical protein
VPRFQAELKQNFVEIPFDPPEVFGEARPPVRGTLNRLPFRGRIAKYDGGYMLGFRREIREGASVAAGDTVDVEIELDTEPRTVDVPDDLAAALDEEARATFDRMAYTHRREYVEWINEAKRPETRTRRVAKAVELIREGKPQR